MCCDHNRQVSTASDIYQALHEFACKRCKKFDLVKEQWRYGDIRIYRATAEDERLAGQQLKEPPRPLRVKLNQLDWVNL
jgi:hypothetical protein